MRAVIFGVDGLTFRVVNPLMARGDLPNFARLRSEGVEAELMSSVPATTPPAWMSMVTGLKPAKHGVYDFWEFDSADGGPKPTLVTHRKGGKAIWNILSEYGKRVIVLNVPVTYPPEPVNGIMVSGLMTPGADVAFTFPNAFKDELYRVVPDYRIDLSLHKTATGSALDAVLEMTEKRIQLQEHLLSEHEWDCAVLAYVGPDRIQHRVWNDIAALSPEATRYYRLLDDALGRVFGHLTADDAVFVASDHGFVGAHQWFYINEYLRQRKLLHTGSTTDTARAKLLGYAREAARALHLLDTARTTRQTYSRLRGKPPIQPRAGLSQPYFTNENWSRSQACVLSSTAFGSGCADIFMSPDATWAEMEELRLALAAERHPETGEPLARAIYATDALGTGSFRPHEQHLILVPHTGTTFHLGVGRPRLWEPLQQPKGIHEEEGVFYAWGAGIRRGVRLDPLEICDLVPTVLQTFGISADEPFDGRTAHEIFLPRMGPDSHPAQGEESAVARRLRQLRAQPMAHS